MQRWDASDVDCEVRTFKEGLLSRVGHDLLFRVQRLQVLTGGEPLQVQATFDAASLQLVCAMRAGERAPDALSKRDRSEIHKNLQGKVLCVARYPEIRFVAEVEDADTQQVRGELTLCGQARCISGVLTRIGDRLELSAQIDQRDFGIVLFSAMFGALKIQPIVQVKVSLPVPKAGT